AGPSMKRLWLMVLLWCAGIHAANAWEPARNAEGELGEFIALLKTSGNSAFVSECQLDDRSKAVVVFPIDSSTGRFFGIRDQIRADHAYAVATGEILVAGNSFRVRIDPSDVVDLERQLATNLMSYPFHLKTPDKLDTIFTEAAPMRC
ncbi:MAG: hypothetical protein ACREC6_15650, partial [Hyphomicrobiaceae bacterium]